jgi:hypothetical protein
MVDRLVETVAGLRVHAAAPDRHRRCMYFGTDDRSTVFFKTSSANTMGSKRPQSLRKGLASITAPASPLAERSEKNFPVELHPKARRLLGEL